MDSNNKEIEITEKDMIVSSTDKKGTIVYANDIFCDIAGYTREEVIGQPHNMIRHPEMPKVVFKLLWERVLKGEVIYAFVKNIAKNGDYYWVKAYVKPIVKNGEVVKITSYRKPLNEFAKKIIIALYDELLEYEKTHSVEESKDFLLDFLEQRKLTYDQFIDNLSLQKNVMNVAIRNLDFNKEKNAHLVYREFVLSNIENKTFEAFDNVNNDVVEFDKWLQSVENEPFTDDITWKRVKQYHSKFHTTLENYIYNAKNGESLESMKNKIAELPTDIENMFNNLTLVRDKY